MTKTKPNLIILGTIFTLAILISADIGLYQGFNYRNLGVIKQPENKIAGYWEIEPIDIQGNVPTLTWAYTASNNDWCYYEDGYYIIENVTIDGQGSYVILIDIALTSEKFIIRNCTLRNGETGIYMADVTNGKIYNNSIYDLWRGIQLHSNDNCSNNVIEENVIYNIDDIGIDLDSWENILNSGTNYNSIVNNNINNCSPYGIYLESGNYCVYNNISSNIISNSENGIYLTSDNNIVYNNSFLGNTINAYDNGLNNQWDYNFIGNYWDNYSGVDVNDDGIGDTPHDVPPAGGSMDNYPIWDDGDDLAPNIIINSPTMNDAFGLNAPSFNIIINDASPINTTWYTIDGGTTNFTFSGFSGTVNQTAWDSKGTEIMTLRFYANDSLGHIGFNDVLIWKDLVAPKITITSPTPNQLCGMTAPTFNIQIIEPNLHEKRYSLNGRPNITFTTETQFSQTEWNQVGNGTVSIIFYAIDKTGNVNSSEVIVRKDTNIPDITIYSPVEDQKFGKSSPDFNISIIEEDLVSTWYTIEGIAGTFTFTGLTGAIDQDAWDDVPEGDITITFYAIDSAGNTGSESVIVIKSIPSEPVIPGYNIIFLLGIVAVIAILIRKKLKKY